MSFILVHQRFKIEFCNKLILRLEYGVQFQKILPDRLADGLAGKLHFQKDVEANENVSKFDNKQCYILKM